MDVAEYIDKLPVARQQRCRLIIETIKGLYPQAEESMKYKMPTYTCNNGWVAVANQKNYISFYTCSAAHIEQFKASFPEIKTGKGCINLRDKDAIPIKALERVIANAIENFGH